MTSTARSILKQVGILLVIAGCSDFLMVLYSLIAGTGYFSTYFIFAILAGYQLMKGQLKLANYIAIFCAFLMVLTAGIFALFLIFTPPDILEYLMAQGPLPSYLSFLLFLVLAISGWSVWKLTSQEVRSAMDEEQISYQGWERDPKTGFLVGLGVVVLMAVSIWVVFPTSY